MVRRSERRVVMLCPAPMPAGVSRDPQQLLALADLQGEALLSQYLQRQVSSESGSFCFAGCSLKITARVSCAGL